MPDNPIAQEFTESMNTASKHIPPPAGGEAEAANQTYAEAVRGAVARWKRRRCRVCVVIRMNGNLPEAECRKHPR